jgi:Outer membrane protein beta-barrel domain
MNVTSRQYLSLALAAIAAVVFIHPVASRADDTGLYGGRTLPSGAPANPPKDQAQLALEPGSVALGGDAARLEGERIFGGYRFGPGFALEGARTRMGASGLGPSNETISVAGVGSVPLSDSVTLVSKLGLTYQPSAFAGNGVSVADVTNGGRLYGVGVAVRIRDNVEVQAQTQHLGRTVSPTQGATASDSVLFGANVRF